MILEVVVAAFVLTQLGYAVVNCGLLAVFLRRPTNVVDERTLGRVLEAGGGVDREPGDGRPTRVHADGGPTVASAPGPGAACETERNADDPGPRCRLPPALRRPIRVFVPLVDHRWGGLEATLESVAAQSYPTALVSVTVVYAPRETAVPELEGAIDADLPPGLEVETLAVDPERVASDRDGDGGERPWWVTGEGTPPATAALLTAAFESRSVDDDALVTVVEAGSWLPVDTFELAVAGLEEYDIVQTKRTVRDVDAGALPLLESMATAARTDLGHRSSAGPYHLLGTGYVTEAGVLEAVAGGRRESGDGAPLGPAAARRGHALGVVDRYVRAECPVSLESWLARKRSRTRDLYRRLFARGWAGVDDLRGWSGTLLLQAIAVLSLVGVPAAALVAALSLAGTAPVATSLALQLLVGFNGLMWAYYAVRAYRAAWEAIPFRSHAHRAAYSILSNPLSQALYATLSAVPICLGIVDAVRGGSASLEQSER